MPAPGPRRVDAEARDGKTGNFGLIAPTGPLNHIDLDPLTFTVGNR